MSHGVHEDVAAATRSIRQVEAEVGRPIGILADLQGPKLRCGTFADGAGRAGRRARRSASTSIRAEGDATRV